jgi:hypothetical protein
MSASSSNVSSMRFELFVGWFESRILEMFQEELEPLRNYLFNVDDCIKSLKVISTSGRVASVANSSGNKLQKIFDLLDATPQLFLPGQPFCFPQPQLPYLVSSQLIDIENTNDFISKVKSKLKLIDEALNSKKNDSGKTKATTSRSETKKGFDPLSIRNEIKHTLISLDNLEQRLSKDVLVLIFFAELKADVHFPVNDMILGFSRLPSIAEFKQLVDLEFEEVKRYENIFIDTRAAECLKIAAKLQNELQFIELCVTDIVQSIRILANADVFEFVSNVVGIAKTDTASSWLHICCSMSHMPIAKLLLRCISKYVEHILASFIYTHQDECGALPHSSWCVLFVIFSIINVENCRVDCNHIFYSDRFTSYIAKLRTGLNYAASQPAFR